MANIMNTTVSNNIFVEDKMILICAIGVVQVPRKNVNEPWKMELVPMHVRHKLKYNYL
jgi:hypothetical protein